MKIFVPVFTAASLLLSTAVLAQTSPSPSTTPATPSSPSTTPSVSPSTSPKAPAASRNGMTMTEEQAKTWIDKAVYSSDNKNVGDVAAIQRDSTGAVTELHADVGGFLGIGTTRVRLLPSQFSLEADRIVLKVPSDQVKTLPKVEGAATPKN